MRSEDVQMMSGGGPEEVHGRLRRSPEGSQRRSREVLEEVQRISRDSEEVQGSS